MVHITYPNENSLYRNYYHNNFDFRFLNSLHGLHRIPHKMYCAECYRIYYQKKKNFFIVDFRKIAEFQIAEFQVVQFYFRYVNVIRIYLKNKIKQ